MTEEKRIESIEKYLEDRMSEAEKLAFEQQLSTDSDLSEDVEHHRKANEVIKYANQKDLKDRLRSIDREAQKGKPRRWLLRQLAIAASVLVLIVAGVFAYNSLVHDNDARLSMSEEEIAVDFHSPATTNQMRSNSKSDAASFSDRLALADIIFESGNYDEASTLYGSLATEQNPQSQKADWNMVIADLAAGNDRYQKELNRIAAEETHLFHERALELKSLLDSK